MEGVIVNSTWPKPKLSKDEHGWVCTDGDYWARHWRSPEDAYAAWARARRSVETQRIGWWRLIWSWMTV